MDPIDEFSDSEMAPSAGEILQDAVQAGREMFAAGQRLLRNFERLRAGSGESEVEVRITAHPYVWIAVGVGACLLIASMLRRGERGEENPVGGTGNYPQLPR